LERSYRTLAASQAALRHLTKTAEEIDKYGGLSWRLLANFESACFQLSLDSDVEVEP
jgi:hypothetical protein